MDPKPIKRAYTLKPTFTLMRSFSSKILTKSLLSLSLFVFSKRKVVPLESLESMDESFIKANQASTSFSLFSKRHPQPGLLPTSRTPNPWRFLLQLWAREVGGVPQLSPWKVLGWVYPMEAWMATKEA